MFNTGDSIAGLVPPIGIISVLPISSPQHCPHNCERLLRGSLALSTAPNDTTPFFDQLRFERKCCSVLAKSPTNPATFCCHGGHSLKALVPTRFAQLPFSIWQVFKTPARRPSQTKRVLRKPSSFTLSWCHAGKAA
jgi:hypothetical protein